MRIFSSQLKSQVQCYTDIPSTKSKKKNAVQIHVTSVLPFHISKSSAKLVARSGQAIKIFAACQLDLCFATQTIQHVLCSLCSDVIVFRKTSGFIKLHEPPHPPFGRSCCCHHNSQGHLPTLGRWVRQFGTSPNAKGMGGWEIFATSLWPSFPLEPKWPGHREELFPPSTLSLKHSAFFVLRLLCSL